MYNEARKNPMINPTNKKEKAPSINRFPEVLFSRLSSLDLNSSDPGLSGMELSTLKQIRSASHWGHFSSSGEPNSNSHMGHVFSNATYLVISL